MDRRRQGIWPGAGLAVNGWRDFYHLHISRGQRLGIFKGWSGFIYSRVLTPNLCSFVLISFRQSGRRGKNTGFKRKPIFSRCDTAVRT